MDKGLKILLKKDWKNQSAENIKLAIEEGYLFKDDEIIISHDECLNRVWNVLKKITPEDVANAFLFSLSTRKLEYRSALGSYWYAIAVSSHVTYDDYDKFKEIHCHECGWYKKSCAPYGGKNVYNYERYKWGGVRHTDLNFALFDLEQFLKLPKVYPTADDKKILLEILHTIDELDGKGKAGKLRERLLKKKIFKTNKNEVSVLLDLLGICGVLSNEENPCYYDKFVDDYDRSPYEHTNDFRYPVNRWYVRDGVNENCFRRVFGFEYE